MFNFYLDYFYLIPISTFILGVVMYSLNHWDTTELEKKVMTNYKRIQIQIAIIIFESILFSIYFYVFIFKDLEIVKEGSRGKDLILQYLLFVLTLFIVSSIFAIAINVVNLFSNKFFKPKYYYLVNMEDKKNWILIRKSNKNQILLKNDQGEHLFLNDWGNLIFTQKQYPLNWLRRIIFKNNNRVNKIIFILISSFVVLSFTTLYILVKISNIESFIILLGTIIILGFAINIYIINKNYYSIK